MAWEIQGDIRSYEAGADLSAAQYKFVKFSAGKVVVCDAVTDLPVGILQNKPTSGHMAAVMINGCSKVVGGADLAFGNLVGPDTSARAAAYVHGTDTTKYIVGYVVEENTAADELCTIEFNCVSAGRAA